MIQEKCKSDQQPNANGFHAMLAREGHIMKRRKGEGSVPNDGSHRLRECLRSWRRTFGEVSKVVRSLSQGSMRSAYVVVGLGTLTPVIGSSSSSSSASSASSSACSTTSSPSSSPSFSAASVASGASTVGRDLLRVMVVVPPRMVEVIRRVIVLVTSALEACQ
jgi:hypothetical protein